MKYFDNSNYQMKKNFDVRRKECEMIKEECEMIKEKFEEYA